MKQQVISFQTNKIGMFSVDFLESLSFPAMKFQLKNSLYVAPVASSFLLYSLNTF